MVKQRKLKVIFRCDSSVEMGGGHLMRCLAFAELFRKKKADIVFVCKSLPGNLNYLVGEKKYFLKEMPANLSFNKTVDFYNSLLGDSVDPIFVFDSYGIAAREEAIIIENCFTIVIDDLHDREHICNLLINNNLLGDTNAYARLLPSFCTTLLGPKYSLLRREFVTPNASTRNNTVIVFFGNGDSSGQTLRFVEAVKKLKPNLRFQVIVGSQNKDLLKIKSVSLPPNLKILVNPANLAALFKKGKLYLGSGGTVTWERMRTGLPGVVMSVAKNQVPSSQLLHDLGYQIYLGPAESIRYENVFELCAGLIRNQKALSNFSNKGKKLVAPLDVKEVLKLRMNLRLRKARLSDAKFLFDLRREPAVALNSVSKQNFSFSHHKKWLRSKLSQPDVSLFTVLYKNNAVGQVRIDSDLTVSIALSQKHRGRGLGAPALILALMIDSKRRRSQKTSSYTALISRENIQSIRMFEKAGFKISRELLGSVPDGFAKFNKNKFGIFSENDIGEKHDN